MRRSTSCGLKVLSSIILSQKAEETLPLREGLSSNRKSGEKASRALAAAARLYGTGDFVAYGGFEHGREVLVHPLADERLHVLHERVGVGVEVLAQERLETGAHRAFEHGLNAVSFRHLVGGSGSLLIEACK